MVGKGNYKVNFYCLFYLVSVSHLSLHSEPKKPSYYVFRVNPGVFPVNSWSLQEVPLLALEGKTRIILSKLNLGSHWKDSLLRWSGGSSFNKILES